MYEEKKCKICENLISNKHMPYIFMVFFLLLIYIAIIFILQNIKLAKIMSIIVFFIKLLLSQKMTDIN